MFITIVHQTSVPDRDPGITRHFALAKALVALGHQVNIVAGSFNHFSRTETNLAEGEASKTEDINGVRFLWLRAPAYGQSMLPRLWSMARFALAVWQFRKDKCFTGADIIVGTTPYPTGALAAMAVAKHLNKPFLLEVRDIWPMTIVQLGGISPWNPGILAFEWMEKVLYQRMDWLVSPLPKAYLRAEEVLHEPCERFTWVSNGVDPDLIPPFTAPNTEEPFEVLYAGLHSRQGCALDTLLEAAAILAREVSGDKLRITFLGDGPFKADLVGMVAAAKLPNVTFEDPVPKRAVYSRLAMANAFVNSIKQDPLYRYGIGINKHFDYLAMARPIIFAGNPVNDIVQESAAGLSVPGQVPESLAEAILAVYRATPKQKAEWGERGRRHLVDHYTTDHLGALLEGAIFKAIAHHAGQEPLPAIDPNSGTRPPAW